MVRSKEMAREKREPLQCTAIAGVGTNTTPPFTSDEVEA